MRVYTASAALVKTAQ